MWPDNETARDFLNFTGVAETVGELVGQANGRPISIGVSGAWGVGKSSMIKLIRHDLENREVGQKGDYVFVEFNAWLYQGYDDARAALLEVIASALAKEAENRKTGQDKTKELLSRVNWLRAAKLTAGSALAMALGLPPVGLIGEGYKLGGTLFSGEATEDAITEAEEFAPRAGAEAAGLIKPKPENSPPREIHAIRECFEQTLSQLGVTLVVLIDDLDRCLPPTTISTLEAIRLFLFLQNTAFVIAADETMIKNAVRSHFDGVDDTLVTNYFDKLVQVPIRVPPLGTQEVRSYLMLLYLENSSLDPSDKEEIRKKVCSQLSQTWRGKRVDRAFVESTYSEFPAELVARFDTADRLAPLMTTTTQISGNPRLIKRFLNALSIRMSLSRAHGVGVDEAVLAKVLLFERCATPTAYSALTNAINNDNEGKPRFLQTWEDSISKGEELELTDPWDDSFVREWIAVPPRLADIDLRGVLYVGREHAPLISPEDRLSSAAADVLTALLENPDMAAQLEERLAPIQRPEISILMDRVLERARQEQEWGTPAILDAALVLVKTDPTQGPRLAGFLKERPYNQIKPSIIPKTADQVWSKDLFDHWSHSNVSAPVKKAITQRRKPKNGNI